MISIGVITRWLAPSCHAILRFGTTCPGAVVGGGDSQGIAFHDVDSTTIRFGIHGEHKIEVRSLQLLIQAVNICTRGKLRGTVSEMVIARSNSRLAKSMASSVRA